MTTGEDKIIQQYFAPLAKSVPGALGLHDDAAILQMQSNLEWVITTDMLVEAVHFFADDDPYDIAIKALAVNLSDLAAKGAQPEVYFLSLALPKQSDSQSHDWLTRFANGLSHMQEKFAIHLAGGDTVSTPGALTINIAAHGLAPLGETIKRSGANLGDKLFVTGTIGDSALGLSLRKDKDAVQNWGLSNDEEDVLRTRYLHPEPRTELIPLLRKYASAAMDISDGLFGDAKKLCLSSNLGGRLNLTDIPLSKAALKVVSNDPKLWSTILTGGDDYEILFAVSPKNCTPLVRAAQDLAIPLRAVGELLPTSLGFEIVDGEGSKKHFETEGYSHI